MVCPIRVHVFVFIGFFDIIAKIYLKEVLFISENENFHDALREGINEVLNAELPIIPTYEDEKAVTMPTYQRNSIEVNLNKLHEFTNHPFKVIDDKDMDKLKASIKHDGILTPIIIRSTAEGEYEIISGTEERKHVNY